MLQIISSSEQRTDQLGFKLGTLLQRGDIVCLTGDLGAGKTTLSKAIARGLDIEEDVTSPTFTIIHEYMGRLPLYHFDVYRIEDPIQMEDLGYEEYFYGDGVCIVEWASKIQGLIPTEHLWVHIVKGIEEEQRIIEIKGIGRHYQEIIEELRSL
ncbi:MAG: tRNA (adenosine(37)-N6)-threonylcarbamoyltransferase complex ATPase subunit type 1 TsaE [Bacillota bacterium]